ncbi:hypothetical protein WA588_001515 [Blastocystis sp. NMH]
MAFDVVLYVTLTSMFLFFNKSESLTVDIHIDTPSAATIADIRGVIHVYHNDDCRTVDAQSNTHFNTILRLNANLRSICLPLLGEGEEINCMCVSRYACSAVLVPETMNRSRCLVERTIIQLQKDAISRVDAIVSSSAAPIIKPIYFTRTSLCVCTALSILFVVFLFLLSAAFDKYSSPPFTSSSWMTLDQLNTHCPVFSTSHVTDDCPICMAPFASSDQLRQLACRHYFHAQCIDRWLLHYKVECPVCKRRVCLE